MNEMTRLNSFEELRSMNEMMDRLMHRWPGNPGVVREDVELSTMDKTLPVDIFEKDGTIVVKAALPGVDPNEIDVSINDGVLQIRAETKREENIDEGDYHRREYRYGRFSRSFRLPNNVAADQAQASFDNGMLRLTIPRTEDAKPRSITVEVK